MDKIVQQALAILRNAANTPDQRRDQFQQLAYQTFNLNTIGQMSLGRPYKALNDTQKAQYQAEFKQLITNAYGHITDGYTDQDVKIVGDRTEADGDSTVQTHLTGTKDGKQGQNVATIDYRLRKADSQWKIIDLTIDGMSMVGNYRSQFSAILSDGGIDKLLTTLRDKNAANANNASVSSK